MEMIVALQCHGCGVADRVRLVPFLNSM